MASYFKIPLSNIPQQFTISLNGIDYVMNSKWNVNSGWIIDIMDAQKNPLVFDIPLTTGLDILEPFPECGIEGQMFVLTDGNDFAVPTLENLGVEANLYFVSNI